MFVVKPPNSMQSTEDLVIFLAGSIEMGKAEDWQRRMEVELDGTACIILNPRRVDWDPKWVQSIDHPEFTEQVTWEMDGIEKAGLVLFYFAPGTKSPISLAELGWAAGIKKKVIVCCPDGFWRKGNVDVISLRHGFTMVNSLEDLIIAAKRYINVVGTRV